MSKRTMKLLLFIFMLIYVVSPADALPGPIDDLIAMFMTMAVQTKLGRTSPKEIETQE